MNCARCQAPLREGATFCTNCGTLVPASAPSSSVSSQMPVSPDPANAPTQMGTGAGNVASGAFSSAPFDPTIRARPADQPMPSSGNLMQVPNAPATGPTVSPAYQPTVMASGPVGGMGSQPIAGVAQQSTLYAQPGGSQPMGSGSVPYGTPPSGPVPGSYYDPYAIPPASGPWPAQTLNPPPLPLMVRLFGTDADAVAARPSTRLQGMLLRNVSLRYAVSKWFTSVLGAVVALGVGILLTLIAQGVWSGALSDLVKIGGTLPQSGSVGDVVTEVKTLLNSSLFNVFLMEHHVPLVAHFSGPLSGENYTLDATLSLPLLGLLLAPALALTLGGYISASSDYHRTAGYSIARGALMGPFYGLLLLFVALLSSSNGNLSDFLNDPQASGTITINTVAWQALLYGVIWGVLFGALGGWIQLHGRRFLAAALSSLQTIRRPRVAGAFAGAGAAFICGLFLALAAVFAFVIFSGVTVAANTLPGTTGTDASQSSLTNAWQVLRLVFTFGPASALSLFSLGAGGPYGYAVTYSGSGDLPKNVSSNVGLIGADHPITNSMFFLLMILPAISYLVGGRVAARVARAKMAGDGMIAGAAMAVPLSVLMALVGLIVGVDFNLSGGYGSQTSGVDVSAGPTFWGTLLAVLIGGAIVGGLGGASEVAMPQLGALPRLLLVPLRPLGTPLFKLFDQLTARPAGQTRSAAESWVYDGALVGVLLGVIVLILYPLNSVLATSIPYPVLRGIDSWAAALLVGLPLVFLTGALVTAFSSPSAQPAPALSGAYIGVAAVPGGGTVWPQAPQPYAPGGMSGYVAPQAPMPAPGVPSQPFPAGAVSGSQPMYQAAPGSQPMYPAAPGSQPMYPATWPGGPAGSGTLPAQSSGTSGAYSALPPTQLAGASGSWPAGASGTLPPTQIAGGAGSQPFAAPGNSGAYPPVAQPPSGSQPFPPNGQANNPGSSPSGQ